MISQSELSQDVGSLPGKKSDAGKEPVFQGLFQYFPRALKAVARVSLYGAKKYNLEYDDINWKRVVGGIKRYSDALARHLLAEFTDPDGIDPETGEAKIYHDEMVAWNALARLELKLIEREKK